MPIARELDVALVFDEPVVRLALRRAQVDTHRQPVLYLHQDCLLCRTQGLTALSRIRVRYGDREIVAVLNVVTGDWLGPDDVALSEVAWQALDAAPGALADCAHAQPPESGSHVRAKVFGTRLGQEDFSAILRDLLASRLSDLEIAAFVTACAGDRMDLDESVALTRAMIAVGDQLDWGAGPVLDKHCVGGLPGNRTSPIVVPIVAALGHRIPKTSSRAITSPAGTADVMATMTTVDLDLALMRHVVEAHGGCLASGGRMHLSPADDLLIQVERPLDFDSDGQMVASILSKKAAAGSTHVLIDIPVGPTAKVRTPAAADAIARRLAFVGEAVGLRVGVHLSDGRQPVGWGIGPALEARDVLAVLRNEADAPADLRERSLDVAGAVLDLLPATPGGGRARAAEVLESGQALRTFLAICESQGGFREPETARYAGSFRARCDGTITAIHNRHLARVAKLAGAPRDATAGVRCVQRVGARVRRGDELLVVQAGTRGGLDFGLAYAAAHPELFVMEDG